MTKFKLKLTPASEWRRFREEGEIVPLSSGRVVKLRPVALDQLISDGELPDILTPVAAKTLWANTDTEALLADQTDLAKHYFDLVNRIVKMVLLYPQIVDADPTDDQCLLYDLSLSERVEVFNMAQQPADLLKKFREQQEANLESLSDSEDDQQSA